MIGHHYCFSLLSAALTPIVSLGLMNTTQRSISVRWRQVQAPEFDNDQPLPIDHPKGPELTTYIKALILNVVDVKLPFST